MKPYIILVFVMVCLAGADIKKPVQKRGAFFGTPFPIDYVDNDSIDISDFYKNERFAYSLKGGFIDINHLGESFQWVCYYQKQIYPALLKEKKRIDLDTLYSTKFCVSIKYPDNWEEVKEKEARRESIELAQYLAYSWTIYHETLTWYGYKSAGVSEKGSAFSPEDGYSDLLGTIIAGKVLQENSDNFDETALKILKSELANLEIQSKETAKKAFKKTKGRWYNGMIYPLNDVWKRNFDIGEDGFVSPVLLEEYESIQLPAPKIPSNPISVKVEIEPKEKQGKKLLEIAGKEKFLEPCEDFPKIIEQIKKEFEKKK